MLIYLLDSQQVKTLKNILDVCNRYLTDIRPLPRRDPLDRLPLEVTEKIFYIVTSEGHKDPTPDSGWRKRPERCENCACAHHAVGFSHVSSRWRQVTLNLPKLWRKINMDCLRLSAMSTIIQRSQNLLLHISIRLADEEKLELVRQLSHRISHFRFNQHQVPQLDDWPQPYWTPEDMRVVVTLDLPQVISYDGSFSYESGTRDLQITSSTLHYLILYSAESIPLTPYPSLTGLVLSHCSMNLSSLLVALSQSPLLEELILEFLWDTLRLDQPEQTLPIVALNRLRILSLDFYDQTAMTAFCQNVTWNSTAAMKIVANVDRAGNSTIPSIVSRAYAVDSTTVVYLALGNRSGSIDIQSDIIGISPSSAVNVVSNHQATPFHQSMDLFPLGQVEELWLGPSNRQRGSWAPSQSLEDRPLTLTEVIIEVLQRLPALETLIIHIDYVEALLHALSTQTASSSFTLCTKLAVIRVGWNIDGPTKSIPELVFDVLDQMATVRPSIQLFIGTQQITPHQNRFDVYEGEVLTPALPQVCTRTIDTYWEEWETAFGPPR